MTAQGEEFKYGDTVLVTPSRTCKMKVALAVGRIPEIDEGGDFYPYVFLSANSMFPLPLSLSPPFPLLPLFLFLSLLF